MKKKILDNRIVIYLILQFLTLIFGIHTIYKGHNLILFRIRFLAGQSFNSHKRLETEWTFLAIADSYDLASLIMFFPFIIYLFLYLINKYDQK